MTPAAFVTLHDVAPAHLDDCRATLDALRDRGADRITLLLVPGRGWSARQLDVVRRLQDAGHTLAGHGWSHQAPDRRSLYHRLHAAALSRDEAEHLSRSRAELLDRVRRCHTWFADHGLGPPSFYVPPAWALGRLTRSDLAALPFRYWETLTGVYDARRDRFRVLPLVGYLADTRTRVVALRATNAFNRVAARLLRRPLRVSVHPPDHRLRLAGDLGEILERDWSWVGVEDVFPRPEEPERPVARTGSP